jgi:5'-deoxynucleotidase YfbR-like HD superfamily hydrolase
VADGYSVAQHSLLVAEIAGKIRPKWPAKWRLAALLHDAPEYVVGDLISPFKAALSLDYKVFENALLDAVHIRFSLPAPLPDNITRVVKRSDRISAYLEAIALAGFEEEEAARIFGRPRGLNPDPILKQPLLSPWPTAIAQTKFLDHFNTLAAESR